MRVKTCPVRIKAPDIHQKTADDDGVFEAIVATWDVDSVGDKILPGAFEDTLADWRTKGDPIPVYWSHRMDDPDYNIGHVLEAKETDDGLWVKGQLDLGQPKADQVYRLLKGRRVTQFSFAYDIDDGGPVDGDKDDGDADEAGDYFELRKLTLHELGPTPIGANTRTELLGVKNAVKETVSDKPWSDFPDSAFDDEQYARACILDRGEDAGTAKQRYSLPVREPDGTLNRNACHAAAAALAGGRGGVDATDEQKAAAARKLVGLYRQQLDEDPPEALVDMAGGQSDDAADGAAAVGDVQTATALVVNDSGAPIRVLTEQQFKLLTALVDSEHDVLSKSATDLRDSIAKIVDGVDGLKDVLARLDTRTDAPSSHDGKARHAQHAASEEPGQRVKGDEPARLGPASTRLRTDLDLLWAEVSAYTE